MFSLKETFRRMPQTKMKSFDSIEKMRKYNKYEPSLTCTVFEFSIEYRPFHVGLNKISAFAITSGVHSCISVHTRDSVMIQIKNYFLYILYSSRPY